MLISKGAHHGWRQVLGSVHRELAVGVLGVTQPHGDGPELAHQGAGDGGTLGHLRACSSTSAVHDAPCGHLQQLAHQAYHPSQITLQGQSNDLHDAQNMSERSSMPSLTRLGWRAAGRRERAPWTRSA